MRCPRCRRAMREDKRTHHKKRKWICPRCGRVRFQTKSRRRHGRRGDPMGRDE